MLKFNTLPPELHERIIYFLLKSFKAGRTPRASLLPDISLVCRPWRAIAQKELFQHAKPNIYLSDFESFYNTFHESCTYEAKIRQLEVRLQWFSRPRNREKDRRELTKDEACGLIYDVWKMLSAWKSSEGITVSLCVGEWKNHAIVDPKFLDMPKKLVLPTVPCVSVLEMRTDLPVMRFVSPETIVSLLDTVPNVREVKYEMDFGFTIDVASDFMRLTSMEISRSFNYWPRHITHLRLSFVPPVIVGNQAVEPVPALVKPGASCIVCRTLCTFSKQLMLFQATNMRICPALFGTCQDEKEAAEIWPMMTSFRVEHDAVDCYGEWYYDVGHTGNGADRGECKNMSCDHEDKTGNLGDWNSRRLARMEKLELLYGAATKAMWFMPNISEFSVMNDDPYLGGITFERSDWRTGVPTLEYAHPYEPGRETLAIWNSRWDKLLVRAADF